jgi:hypothetical protein
MLNFASAIGGYWLDSLKKSAVGDDCFELLLCSSVHLAVVKLAAQFISGLIAADCRNIGLIQKVSVLTQ